MLALPQSSRQLHRYQDKGWPIGHEAQIDMTLGDPVKTGSIYIVKKHLKAPAKDDEWFKYEIFVRGTTIETKVNGKTVVTYEKPSDVKGPRKLSSGTIGIQAHDPRSVVLVKNIKVKPLAVERSSYTGGTPLPHSGQYGVNGFPMDVGQTEPASLVAIGEAFMVDPQQVHDRCL